MRTSIKLVTKQIYNFGIVNYKYNPLCPYSPLVPKQYIFMLVSEQVKERRRQYLDIQAIWVTLHAHRIYFIEILDEWTLDKCIVDI